MLIGGLTIGVKPFGVAGIAAAAVINQTISLVFLAILWRRK
jgi:Na+-driven multidrug efflux pump